MRHSLIPAVPVPFRGTSINEAALRSYATWMSAQPVAGVAVWAHTGRGPHLTGEQRRLVLEVWREAMPDRIIVAGVRDITTAIEARRDHADALLVFPEAKDPVQHHKRLGRELPVIAFHLYAAAGGVDYDDATLDRILELPEVIGIKVATLDSVMTFQRIADRVRAHPGKLLITGEDRFLGYSLMMGSDAALIGMGGALTGLQARLIRAHADGDLAAFHQLSAMVDRFSQVTFIPPIEGYIRRMLWAIAAEGAIPEDACNDPWGPALPENEREAVQNAVRDARAAGA
ncbi:MAG: dihydrodipicolinate synthase family protein [Gemmatimonadota bacterium]